MWLLIIGSLIIVYEHKFGRFCYSKPVTQFTVYKTKY